MAEIKLIGQMKVKTLKADFKKAFGGTLRVYKSPSCKGGFADDNATLAAIRAEGAKGGELNIVGQMQVGNFEKKIAEMYGIGIQVANADDTKLVDNSLTLGAVSRMANGEEGSNVIKAVEEKLGTSNDIKDIDSKETPTENKSGLKKFTIEIKVKGIHEIAYSAIDTDEYDVDELTEDDVWNFDMEYLTSYALGDEWEGPFELKVYDENGDVVYENDCFEDFKKLSPGEYEIYVEDGDIDADDELCKKVESLLEERHEEDMSLLEEGIYLLQITEAKWKVMKFDLEAETFDPEQLFFVWNPQLSGAYYDYFTDCNHVLYKDHFLEFYIDDEDDVCDDYGTTYRIAERNDHYFSLIRDIEE